MKKSEKKTSVILEDLKKFHRKRAEKHLYYDSEYDTIGDQIEDLFPNTRLSDDLNLSEFNKDMDKKSIGKSIGKSKLEKTPRKLNVTMIIRSEDSPYYKKWYGLEEIHNNGKECIVQGQVRPSDLEKDSFYEHLGSVHEFYPEVEQKDIDDLDKEFKLNQKYIAEKINSDIRELQMQIEQKKKVLKLYQKTIK